MQRARVYESNNSHTAGYSVENVANSFEISIKAVQILGGFVRYGRKYRFSVAFLRSRSFRWSIQIDAGCTFACTSVARMYAEKSISSSNTAAMIRLVISPHFDPSRLAQCMPIWLHMASSNRRRPTRFCHFKNLLCPLFNGAANAHGKAKKKPQIDGV